jgi:hypothetical protein
MGLLACLSFFRLAPSMLVFHNAREVSFPQVWCDNVKASYWLLSFSRYFSPSSLVFCLLTHLPACFFETGSCCATWAVFQLPPPSSAGITDMYYHIWLMHSLHSLLTYLIFPSHLLFLKFIYSYVHTLFGSFLPQPPSPSLFPPPHLASRQNLFALFFNFVEEKT